MPETVVGVSNYRNSYAKKQVLPSTYIQLIWLCFHGTYGIDLPEVFNHICSFENHSPYLGVHTAAIQQ